MLIVYNNQLKVKQLKKRKKRKPKQEIVKGREKVKGQKKA